MAGSGECSVAEGAGAGEFGAAAGFAAAGFEAAGCPGTALPQPVASAVRTANPAAARARVEDMTDPFGGRAGRRVPASRTAAGAARFEERSPQFGVDSGNTRSIRGAPPERAAPALEASPVRRGPGTPAG